MFSGLKVHVVIQLCTSALDCTICGNHFHCYFSLLVSFVLFGYVMKCLYSEVFCGTKYPYSFMWMIMG